MAEQENQVIDAEIVEEIAPSALKMPSSEADIKRVTDAVMLKLFAYLWGIEETNTIPKGQFKEIVHNLSLLSYQAVLEELQK